LKLKFKKKAAAFTGVMRLCRMVAYGSFHLPAININYEVTKSNSDNVCGCRPSHLDAIMLATDVMIEGRRAQVYDNGDLLKRCTFAMRGVAVQKLLTAIDPFCALQACMDGFQAETTDSILRDFDIFTSATGNINITTVEHLKKGENSCHFGNFDQVYSEIDMNGLVKPEGITVDNIKPQVDNFNFPDGHGAAHSAAESTTGTHVNGCTTDDLTNQVNGCTTDDHIKSVDAQVSYIDPGEKEKKNAYSTMFSFTGGKYLLVAYITKPTAKYDCLGTAAYSAAKSLKSTPVNDCTTDDLTTSQNQLMHRCPTSTLVRRRKRLSIPRCVST